MEDREADIHKFSTSSSQHRLPTVSAIEALHNAAAKAKGIPSGLSNLDAILLNSNNGISLATPGIQRGYVTEVYGPPGVGKTTFGIQIAVNAMHSAQEYSHVLWVNTGSPLIERRLEQLMDSYIVPATEGLASSPPESPNVESLLEEKFTYLDAHTLPRLLTVFLHPPTSLPSPKTSVIIVDDLSNLLLGAFSRTPKSLKPSIPAAVKEKLEKQAASKRFQIIETFAAGMSKMAAVRNIAIVVLTNATTSLKSSKRAILKPALSSQAWESAVHTRIMLYRDFMDEEHFAGTSEEKALGLRYAEVQRIARKDVFTAPVPFTILPGGVHQLNTTDISSQKQPLTEHEDLERANGHDEEDELPLLPAELSQPSHQHSPRQLGKRKITEIADSEDEDDEDMIGPKLQHDEPELPKMNVVSRTKQDEMILETHEMALLRRDRHAWVRGSEDEIPVPSSDAEQDTAGSP